MTQIGCLVDTTRCIGCRSCQVACKESKGLGSEQTEFFAAPGGYQNPKRFSPQTFTYVSYHELEGPRGGVRWVFVKRQCLHCTQLYCAAVCPMGVFYRSDSGVVEYEGERCVGCGACVDSCPFQVPAIEYRERAVPRLRKCTFCIDRQRAEWERIEVDGRPLSGESLARYSASLHMPACARACPSGAIQFGPRPQLLEEAHRRIAAHPDRYVNHVYGEKEAGGTAWLYLAGVDFEKLGFPVRFIPVEMFRVGDFGQNQPGAAPRRDRRRRRETAPRVAGKQSQSPTAT